METFRAGTIARTVTDCIDTMSRFTGPSEYSQQSPLSITVRLGLKSELYGHKRPLYNQKWSGCDQVTSYIRGKAVDRCHQTPV